MAMTIEELETLYGHHPQLDVIASAIGKKTGTHVLVRSVCGSARGLLLAGLFQKKKRTQLVVMENQEEAAYLKNDLETALGSSDKGSNVYLFPTTHRLRQKGQDESYTIQRTEVLSRLSSKDEPCIVVTYPDAICESVVAQEQLRTRSVQVKVGQEIQEQTLVEQLSDLGFVRVDFVYEPGQFAVRGGIFDIYSYSYELPFRLDFFGDEIDSIRIFDIETQLSKEKVQEAEIVAGAGGGNGSGLRVNGSGLREIWWMRR